MKVHDLRGLGLRTDIELLRFEGDIRERDGYLVAHSPTNPGYHWGNLVVFPEAPKAGDREKWEEIFAREFAGHPKVRNRTFTWDVPEGSPGASATFARYNAEETDILLLRREHLLLPRRLQASVEVRVLKSDSDWEAAFVNQMSARPASLAEEPFTRFKRAQMSRYRRMGEAGLGAWYGAFRGAELLATCGLYLFDDVGRFQSVVTHPAHQRQGACTTLMHHAAHEGLRTASTLVIAADPGYHAIELYRGLGFQASEKQWGLCLPPKEHQA